MKLLCIASENMPERQGAIHTMRTFYEKSLQRVFLQPIVVLLLRGCSKHFAINVALTLLGLIPGIVHMCYIVLTDVDSDDDDDHND